MKTFTVDRRVLFGAVATVLLLAFPDGASAQSCTQTLSVGANVASAVASAANNSTICLNNGNYGGVNFTNANRTGYVILRSTSGTGATISPAVNGAGWIKFQSLTISGSDVTNCAHHIQFLGSTFTSGLFVTNQNASCAANMNLLVDGNTFGDLGTATYEGRISVADDDGPQVSMGLTISNNVIGPGCQSDGIQLVGGASGVTIGPGNIFDGISQTGPVHCDMIQFYGSGQNDVITGNWFRNGSTVLTHHSGTPTGTQFTNNVLSNVQQLQVGTSANFVFEHNTIYRLTDVFTIVSGTNNIIRDNIMLNSIGLGTSGCSGCTVSFNMCNSNCTGTNQIIGTPTFVGGTIPTTWAGWQLTATSLGNNAGHDGKDVGVDFSGATPPPSAPTNLHIVP